MIFNVFELLQPWGKNAKFCDKENCSFMKSNCLRKILRSKALIFRILNLLRNKQILKKMKGLCHSDP